MKTLRKYIETLAMLLSALILFQSCVVYQRTPVTLAQAADANKKAKVEMKSHEKYRFKSIVSENGRFYGLKKTNDDMVKISLEENNILSIRLQDKSTSTLATIGTVIVSALAALLTFYFIDTGGGDWLDLSK